MGKDKKEKKGLFSFTKKTKEGKDDKGSSTEDKSSRMKSNYGVSKLTDADDTDSSASNSSTSMPSATDLQTNRRSKEEKGPGPYRGKFSKNSSDGSMMDDFFVSEPSQVDITEPLDDQSIEDDDAYLVGHALYDYEPGDADEIELKAGEIVFVFHQHDSGWWTGECMAKYGIFPASYVQIDPDEDQGSWLEDEQQENSEKVQETTQKVQEPEKDSEKPPSRAPEKIPERAPEKAPDRAPDRVPEKTTEKPPERAPDKVPEKAPEKAPERPPDRVPDKVPEKKGNSFAEIERSISANGSINGSLKEERQHEAHRETHEKPKTPSRRSNDGPTKEELDSVRKQLESLVAGIQDNGNVTSLKPSTSNGGSFIKNRNNKQYEELEKEIADLERSHSNTITRSDSLPAAATATTSTDTQAEISYKKQIEHLQRQLKEANDKSTMLELKIGQMEIDTASKDVTVSEFTSQTRRELENLREEMTRRDHEALANVAKLREDFAKREHTLQLEVQEHLGKYSELLQQMNRNLDRLKEFEDENQNLKSTIDQQQKMLESRETESKLQLLRECLNESEALREAQQGKYEKALKETSERKIQLEEQLEKSNTREKALVRELSEVKTRLEHKEKDAAKWEAEAREKETFRHQLALVNSESSQKIQEDARTIEKLNKTIFELKNQLESAKEVLRKYVSINKDLNVKSNVGTPSGSERSRANSREAENSELKELQRAEEEKRIQLEKKQENDKRLENERRQEMERKAKLEEQKIRDEQERKRREQEEIKVREENERKRLEREEAEKKSTREELEQQRAKPQIPTKPATLDKPVVAATPTPMSPDVPANSETAAPSKPVIPHRGSKPPVFQRTSVRIAKPEEINVANDQLNKIPQQPQKPTRPVPTTAPAKPVILTAGNSSAAAVMNRARPPARPRTQVPVTKPSGEPKPAANDPAYMTVQAKKHTFEVKLRPTGSNLKN